MGAVVIHQYDFLQEVFRGAVDEAAHSSFDHRQSLVQVDQHHSNSWQVLRVIFFKTPMNKKKDF